MTLYRYANFDTAFTEAQEWLKDIRPDDQEDDINFDNADDYDMRKLLG